MVFKTLAVNCKIWHFSPSRAVTLKTCHPTTNPMAFGSPYLRSFHQLKVFFIMVFKISVKTSFKGNYTQKRHPTTPNPMETLVALLIKIISSVVKIILSIMAFNILTNNCKKLHFITFKGKSLKTLVTNFSNKPLSGVRGKDL